jgi:hypothetical protein
MDPSDDLGIDDDFEAEWARDACNKPLKICMMRNP